jgi:2-succinyl-5-enolpyruvyl-6-hydroxy-3-cyclohexene-1-carboxylate synthase
MASPVEIDSRNVNTLWASVLVATLARAGVKRAVISPGSRSTPLTLALARSADIVAVPVLDERSAAFFALGLAKASGRPVVLVCTSGSAAANYLPALVEAQAAGVRLLVLTADRPAEMRACSSGQTIDQVKLYGSVVTHYLELPLPEASLPLLRALRQTVLHALERTSFSSPGPVHLNVPLRDPLAPVPDDGAAARVADGVDWEHFLAHVAEPARLALHGEIPPLHADVHGVIVVGPAHQVTFNGSSVAEIARRLGWPVLADGLSTLRQAAVRVPNLVTTYDAILRDPAQAERLKPEMVLAIGSWPASKVLRGWIEASGARIWQIDSGDDNRDGLHGRTRRVRTSLSVLAASLPIATEPSGYTLMWTRREASVRAELDRRLDAETTFFEPKAAWLLARHLPVGTPVVLGNSMPVRDVEYVWPAGDRALRTWCNRGANGIDGTVSTALGIAEASGRPAVLLTGDLAFLHDANGLLLRRHFRGALTVVVINNDGGGIFEHLPVAQFDPPFEEFFATPQAVDLAALCAAHGVAHERVADWAGFTALISTLPDRGLRVLEVRTDRKHDAAARRQLLDVKFSG